MIVMRVTKDEKYDIPLCLPAWLSIYELRERNNMQRLQYAAIFSIDDEKQRTETPSK